MISRLLLRMILVPLAALLVVGGVCFYWYSTTKATYELRAEQYQRLETAKGLLAGLRERAPRMRQLKATFDKVNDPTVVDSARFWLSQNAFADSGVELEQATVSSLTSLGAYQLFGSLSCKFNCRANGISAYLAKAMNEFPNLAIVNWTLDANNNPKKVLTFSATLVLMKLK